MGAQVRAAPDDVDDVAEEDTEYEWLVPDGPADPDRAWAFRDCGDGAEGAEDDDG